MQPAKVQAATDREIRTILGPVDDETIMAIMDIGATALEVEEAFEWLNDDSYMGSDLARPMRDRVRRVYEILEGERDRLGRDQQ